MAFYSVQQLQKIGFKSIGNNVLISDKSSIYRPDNIEIADNVRIDDFVILSAGTGGIYIGNYIHIACYSSLIGKGRIFLDDYANISSRVSIYSSNDDYSGMYMTNPMVPEKYTNVHHADVRVGKHVIVGSGSVILPGVSIGDGSAVGALSLVHKNVDAGIIVAGMPAKKIKARNKNIFELELQFRKELFL